MVTVSYTELRKHFKDYYDKVCDDSETVVVKRNDGRDVVIINMDEYNNLMKNMYIMSNKKNSDR